MFFPRLKEPLEAVAENANLLIILIHIMDLFKFCIYLKNVVFFVKQSAFSRTLELTEVAY